MVSKYVALCEEVSAFGTAAIANSLYFKMLSEGINTVREDFFPETTEYWTTADRTEGLFRGSGPIELLMHPLTLPKLMVLFIGDGGSVGAGGAGTGSGSGFKHRWLFGANESVTVNGAGVKSFTTIVGHGVEKDRQINGCFIEGITITAVAREPCTVTLNLITSGDENLATAVTPTYTAYTDTYSVEQPYLTFANVQTMTISGTNKLTVAPKIQGYTLDLNRSYDTDFYNLGNKFLGGQVLSGFASASGSMDFEFSSQDEHERFLSQVGGTAAGDQASFVIILTLRGNQIGSGGTYYDTTFTMSECHYTSSEIPQRGRDRIVQTVNFRANYNSTDSAACKIEITADTQSYASLA